MKSIKTTAVSLLALAVTSHVSADELNKSQISKKFQELTPFEVISVEDSPSKGLYQVITNKGIFYTTKDGEHVISGALHDLAPGLKNNTEARKLKIAEEKISELKSSFITFPAPNPKHEVIVFYDTSCGYCQKLHHEISTYNAAGITVHYAGFPRMGLENPQNGQPSPTVSEMTSIWCADSQQMALNMVSRGAEIPAKKCDTKIAEHFSLGEMLGVAGTPAIFSMKGNLVKAGYAPASVLKTNLEGITQ
ncbi:disulfide isomerase DsbC N-terminal domain-containing protein [Rheinheimera hassiensis]|uniref:disulfide isomerase DsbC N-terminal domain-containing protein n=1 Tax=Rheinheimera hassiensis TaxID=1193627 RepID=UPI001F05A78C|nr:thioredoxin fold domain-containing protein [Rheinheimera hassiensis]